MRRKICIAIALLVLCCAMLLPKSAFAMSQTAEQSIPLFDKVGDLFFPSPNYEIKEKVYLSGKPVGITVDGEGVMVIRLNEFVSDNGVVCPASLAGIQVGDKIVSFGGVAIDNVNTLIRLSDDSHGTATSIVYIRDGKEHNTTITPALDILSNTYKIGVWVKDGASGVGTLTYIRSNMQFGCLGHPIIDVTTNDTLSITQGSIYDCTITDIVVGEKGKAGELRGQFDIEDKIGTLYINNRYGVYGNMSTLPDDFKDNLYSVAPAYKVRPGKAQILTTIEGNTPKLYDVEIIKVVPQTSVSDKGIVLRITDKLLLQATGGIVQGMSGSPIIQDGIFVGAVTHVFINDPTRGYGILAEWMLEN
ncbi:MAG: SpoIVB peptidase [Clostridia bacterium]|nr:SpoIVB peptidase [Clostridia bacterium]